MSRILWGIVIAIIGFFITFFSNNMLRWFGRLWFAEKHFGSFGGTRLFYQLLGATVMIIGFMMMTNLLGPLILGVLGGIFGGVERS